MAFACNHAWIPVEFPVKILEKEKVRKREAFQHRRTHLVDTAELDTARQQERRNRLAIHENAKVSQDLEFVADSRGAHPSSMHDPAVTNSQSDTEIEIDEDFRLFFLHVGNLSSSD